MKFSFATLVFSFSIFWGISQEVVFTPSDWQDPAIFEINQTRPHALMVPWATVEDALRLKPETSRFFLSLNGTWKFYLADHPRNVPPQFHSPQFNASAWADIPVPSNWEMEGFGHPKFRNIAMTIETKPPFAPDYFNPTGCYKRTFQLPAAWKERTVFLRFEGVKSASYVWVNGKPVGYNQGGFEPAEYDISPFLKQGRNDISVQVMRYCDGSFLENQDMWRLSGIFRDVSLIAKPKVHLHDHYVVTTFDSNYKDAVMKVEVDVQNHEARQANHYSVEVNLLGSDLVPIFEKPLIQQVPLIEQGKIKTVSFQLPVSNPRQWSAEKPELYLLTIILRDGPGRISEVFARRAGFRQTEVRDGAIWVNGAMVKLNGVNSHMHHPRHGQAVPLETMRQDLLIMKQFNINCVRTSHYPHSPGYLDLADEMGMYIVCETGDECHDNEYLSEKPEWKAMFVDRAVKMVYRDRNHPSVIFWSAGNEAGEGENLKALMETCRKIDPSRQYWMYGGNQDSIPFEDIIGPRYWRPLELKNLAEYKTYGANDKRPSFQDEYLAATGNGLGGLDEYWELIWKYPRLTGGAIWDWISPGVYTPVIRTPDLSPLENHPLIMGRPSLTNGKSGKAIHLSGHDDWVEFYRHPRLDLAGDALAIEFQVRPEENFQPNTFVTKGSHQFGVLQPDLQTIEFYVHTNRRHGVTAKVPPDWYHNWHHVAALYNNGKIELYIDFEKVAAAPATGRMQNTPYPICLGRDAELHDQGEHRGRLSACAIDEFRLYGLPMTIEQIKNQSRQEALQKSLAALDFDETSNEGEFFAVGLGGRTYGIVWPDRSLQPEIHQIKKSAQPVDIKMVNPENGNITVSNRYNFTNLNKLVGRWELAEAGKTVESGIFTVDARPGETAGIKLPFKIAYAKMADPLLTVSFHLKNDHLPMKAGHEVAWEQFSNNVSTLAPVSSNTGQGPLRVEETDGKVSISGSGFQYVFDKSTGLLESLDFQKMHISGPGMALSVWRAPLANDMDPWGAREFTRENYTPGLGRSIDNQLRTLGLEKLVPQVYDFSFSQAPAGELVLRWIIYATGSRKNTGFEEHREYRISPDGSVVLNHTIIPHGDMPAMLPKVGLELLLPTRFSHIEWYGRGPFETYPDRKTGAKVGIYKSTVEQEYVPYLIPQEHGNKTDIRWLKISDGQNNGLVISSDKLLNFSAHQFTTDNLTRAAYPFQLQKAGHITLNLDYEVTGVGDTSRRQLAKYRVRPTVKQYTISLKPFVE